ncbi:MAG: hypothetical protein CUN56_02690 [Phototrophicales bacterium]|nr:MAG: hypothetical protein CUN56_02690 [Phototrophicales bacterium]
MTNNSFKTSRLFILIGLTLLAALPILTYPLGRDQGEFATIGQGILDGRIPYSDLWNPKPPAVFYVYASFIRLFGVSSVTIRLIDLTLFTILALLIYWVMARLKGVRTAYIAVVMFAYTYFRESFWTLSQNDGIAILPMMAAVFTAFKAYQAGWQWALLSGMMSAVVLWFKYPFIYFVIALILGYVYLTWGDWRKIWHDALAFALGGVLVGGGGIIYLASQGALDDLIQSAQVTMRYTAFGYDPSIVKAAIHARFLNWGWLTVLAGVGWLSTRKQREWRIVDLWCLAAILILVIQRKGYDYHWLPMLPALVFFAAVGINRLTQFNHLIAAGVICGLLVHLATQLWFPAWGYLHGEQSQLVYYSRFRGGEFAADETQQVVDYLRANTSPGETLFIWGFRAEVYYLTELRPATRFIFNYPLIAPWYPAEWKQETVNTLWLTPPKYVLVLRGDFMPWVTGRHDAASNQLLREFKELEDWLIFNYEEVQTIGNFIIWQRKA